MSSENKVFSWSFIGWLAALLGSMSAILAFAGWLLKPHIDGYIVDVHNKHEQSLEDPSKVSFRELLSDETKIPADRIHIEFGDWWNSHLAVEELLDEVYPILEEELTCIIPKLVILPNGRPKWYDIDGEIYDASLGQDGFHWFYKNGVWKPCKF